MKIAKTIWVGRIAGFDRVDETPDVVHVGAGAQRNAVGDLVQPTRQRGLLADGADLAGQHHERRLEGVFGVLLVVQHAATDAEDQRASGRGPGGLAIEQFLGARRSEFQLRLGGGDLDLVLYMFCNSSRR